MTIKAPIIPVLLGSPAGGGGGGGQVDSVQGGTDISVDATDPVNPIVNFTGSGLDTSNPTTWTTGAPSGVTITVGGQQVGATTTYHLMKILYTSGSTITQGVNTVLAGSHKIGFNVLDMITGDTEHGWFVSGVTHLGAANEAATFYKFDPVTGTASYEAIVGNNAVITLTEDGSNNRSINLNSAGTGTLNIGNLPTSAAGLASGDIWNNAGSLDVV